MTVPRKNQPTASSEPFRRDLISFIPHLRAFARNLCGERELGEDLAQSALVKAWRSQDKFHPGTNMKAWLFTILRNEFFTYKRRSWRQTHWDEIKGARIATPTEPQYWALELSDAARGLRELPDGQREALILVGAAGFSYDEAAKICAMPVGTVKSRVARGRLALAEILEGERTIHGPYRKTNESNDILAQLDVLMPAGASCAAHA